MSNSQNPRNSRAIQARRNGSKSQGPVSLSGKQISSKNAIKHGLFSPQVVLPTENQADFDALLSSLVAELNPEGEIEFQLTQDIAAARWRIPRIQHLETALMYAQIETNRTNFDQVNADDPEGPMKNAHRAAEAYRDLIQGESLDTFSRHESRLQRQYTRALNALLKLQRTRKPAELEPGNVGCAAARVTLQRPDRKAPTSSFKHDPTPDLCPNALKNHQNEPKKAHSKVYPIRKINTERTR